MSKMKKKYYKQRKKKRNRSLITIIRTNYVFILVIIIIGLVFIRLVNLNKPITEVDKKGLELLNKYEYPNYLVSAGNCMEPYDVGDGVVTFGPGITYDSLQAGLDDINQTLNKSYTEQNSCIKEKDLFKMQEIKLKDYERIIINIENYYELRFNQDQFNGLLLLAYNSPSLFNDSHFISVITNPQSSEDQYILAADLYYQSIRGYDTTYGNGWYNRIVDSAQVYYNGEYKFQNN